MDLAPEIRDSYRDLDLEPGAGLDEVRLSYRRLAKALHPDRHPGSVGSLMARINRAYERLLAFWEGHPGARRSAAPERRQAQEQDREPAAPAGGLASRQGDPAGTPAPSPGVRGLAQLAVLGGRLMGITPQAGGLLYRVLVNPGARRLSLPVKEGRPCPRCGGSGHLGRHTCPACAGRGRILAARQVELPLPAAWRPGQVEALAGRPGGVPVWVELWPLTQGGEARS
ncbi:MAG: DnaJ domain-containing protein [Deltaproteobacteria bacterium]|nr:DnaJ domain-containing protein [Deltaproteobacteria bacterium]